MALYEGLECGEYVALLVGFEMRKEKKVKFITIYSLPAWPTQARI